MTILNSTISLGNTALNKIYPQEYQDGPNSKSITAVNERVLLKENPVKT
jgi:hypothetical protein